MDSDPDSTVILDPSSLSIEELQEEYSKISKFYLDTKKTNDECLQEIYELKRNFNTANATERFLTQELESIQLSHKDDVNKLNEKFRAQLLDIKQRSQELSKQNGQLELKVEELEVKVEKLEQELRERNDVSVEVTTSQFEQKECDWEKRNSELVEFCTGLSKKIEEFENQIYNLQSDNSCLKERLECAEDNLCSKKEEVMEKDIVIDGLHGKLIELASELNVIKNLPPQQNKKGNSLFAEVDDQRQLMKNILSRQKKQYMQMQKQFSEREYEIRRLKQENAAIHKEMEICSSIFTKADTNYRTELQKRIKVLMEEQRHLEEKLKMNEQLLSEMPFNKGMNWVDKIMMHCKNETDEFKKKYFSCLLEKSILEENYLKSQQTLAKWRFEALKSRCIILDRENKLIEHKIPFDPVEFTAQQESELQNFEPIVSFKLPAIKQDDQITIFGQFENIQSSSNHDISTISVSEIKSDIDVKMDLSDESIASLSPQAKSERINTSEGCSSSESFTCETVLSPPKMSSPPPLAQENKNFSIFCDSIVEVLPSGDLNSNQTTNSIVKVEMDTSEVLLPSTVFIPPENIKKELDAKPVEKSKEICNIAKKKNNLIIRKVFIKSKK